MWYIYTQVYFLSIKKVILCHSLENDGPRKHHVKNNKSDAKEKASHFLSYGETKEGDIFTGKDNQYREKGVGHRKEEMVSILE